MQQNSRGATEQRSGKRKSIGKRKLSDQEAATQQPQHQQATISELLSRNHTPQGKGQQQSQDLSPTSKRMRFSPSPSVNPSASDNMYNLSNADSKPGGPPFGQSGAGGKARSLNAASRQSNFTPHTGAKKLVVKNLRTGPRLNQDSYFDKVWGQLDDALTAVFDGGKPATSLEELYKGAENICRQGRAAVLAQRLQDRCREHVSGKLRESLVAKAGGGTSVDALRAVVESWAAWQSKLV